MKIGAVLKGLIVAMVVGASLIVAALARAGDAPAAAPAVTGPQAEIRVRVIHAKNAPTTKFDPHLEDLKKFLQNFTNYDFREVIDQSLTLGVGKDDTKGIGLLSGKNLNVTLLGLTREKATMRLELVGQTGQMLDTTVSAGPHKLFFIAGPRYDNGVLFIAIEPHYDPDSISSAAVSDTGAHPVQ